MDTERYSTECARGTLTLPFVESVNGIECIVLVIYVHDIFHAFQPGSTLSYIWV